MKTFNRTIQDVMTPLRNAIRVASLLGYCYLVGLLCWLIVTPSQQAALDAIRAHEHTYSITLLDWCITFGVLFIFDSILSSTLHIAKVLKDVGWSKAQRQTDEYCLGLFFFIAPYIAYKGNVTLREIVNPTCFLMFAAFFLLAFSARFYRMEQIRRAATSVQVTRV